MQPVPFPEAVLNAANAVFSAASAGAHAGQRQVVVIDPLVNGVTGEQSAATQQIQDRIVALAREKYPQFDIQPFSAAAVSKAPYVMVGTFTPVNAQGQTAGTREGYRFCLVMVDLRAGKTVAKGVARARVGRRRHDAGRLLPRQSRPGPTIASVKSYIDTCQATKVGDTISQTYLNGILTASIVSEAIDAYDASRYRDALELYVTAEKTPAGNQLRVYNGLYLTNWKLGQRDQAAEAFGRVVDYGLDNNALGVKILFRPGSTVASTSDPQTSGPYDMWLRQIAGRSASRNACLQVTGNSSPSGVRRTQRPAVAAARRVCEGPAGDGRAGAARACHLDRRRCEEQPDRHRRRRSVGCAGPQGRVQGDPDLLIAAELVTAGADRSAASAFSTLMTPEPSRGSQPLPPGRAL